MSFADEVRKKAASAPSVAELEERMLNKIYENYKRFILYQAERGERVIENVLYGGSFDRIRLKGDSSLLKHNTYDNSISCKDLLYRNTRSGLFKEKTTFSLTAAGKMVVDYINKKSKEDGFAVSFVVSYSIRERGGYEEDHYDCNIGEKIKHFKNAYISYVLCAKYIV